MVRKNDTQTWRTDVVTYNSQQTYLPPQLGKGIWEARNDSKSESKYIKKYHSDATKNLDSYS